MKVLNIRGGGGGQGSEYSGPRGGGKFFAGCKLIGAHNQCQIITFLTLKTDNIAKLRIKLKSILIEIPLNKIKGTHSRTSVARTLMARLRRMF